MKAVKPKKHMGKNHMFAKPEIATVGAKPAMRYTHVCKKNAYNVMNMWVLAHIKTAAPHVSCPGGRKKAEKDAEDERCDQVYEILIKTAHLSTHVCSHPGCISYKDPPTIYLTPLLTHSSSP
jgi:hypothetical protein